MWDAFKVSVFGGDPDALHTSIAALREARHGWGTILSALITTWCHHYCQSGAHEIAAHLARATKQPRDIDEDLITRLSLAMAEHPVTPASNGRTETTMPPEPPTAEILADVDPTLVKWVRRTFHRSTRPWVWSLVLQTGHTPELIHEYLEAIVYDCEKNGLKSGAASGITQALWCLAKAKWSSSMIDVYESIFMYRLTKTNLLARTTLLEWILGWDVSEVLHLEERGIADAVAADAKSHKPQQQQQQQQQQNPAAYLFSVIPTRGDATAPTAPPSPPEIKVIYIGRHKNMP
jgi:hypothetical protein